MKAKLKQTTYCDEEFTLEGLVVEVEGLNGGYEVLGSELIKHGAPELLYNKSGYSPTFPYFLCPSEVEILEEK